MKSPITVPDKYVKEVDIFGLKGRMGHIPKKGSNKTIILIHGQHARLERYFALVEYLSDFGEIYAPDLPGFGGMDSFYKIKKQPTYDNYADYLYELIEQINPDKPIYFVGMSYGSQVTTRLLQKYPELYPKIGGVIGFVGFGAGSDFDMGKKFKAFLMAITYFGSSWLGSKIMEILILNPLSLRILVWFISRNRTNMKLEKKHKDEAVQLEKILWKYNDNRTHCSTTISMFTDDLRNYSTEKIPFKLVNTITTSDQFFNNEKVKATFLDLYDDYEEAVLNLDVHAPSILASKSDVKKIIPDDVDQLLSH